MSLCLISISLTACSTLEIVHEPIECLGPPIIPQNLKFSQDEAAQVPSFAIDKFKKISNIYKKRISAICKLNSRHNARHGGD
jgi:hypothetical protein